MVLSGDHIYKMNYAKMIDFHKKHNADCTIAVLESAVGGGLPLWYYGDRRGRPYLRICREAGPAQEQQSLYGRVCIQLEQAAPVLGAGRGKHPNSANDFGKNVIPAMLNAGERLFAYPFSGYWKDVGTIDSLWEANLDIINPNVNLDMSDKSWRIYSRNPMAPPHYIGKSAVVENSSMSESCEIEGNVDYSVISSNVTIEAGADVRYSVVMPGAHIKKVPRCIIPSWPRTRSFRRTPKSAKLRATAKPGRLGHCRYRCRRYRHRQEGHCTR